MNLRRVPNRTEPIYPLPAYAYEEIAFFLFVDKSLFWPEYTPELYAHPFLSA